MDTGSCLFILMIATTAFCPGSGMGLFQFKCMPFGLTGAPSSFQRLMNQLFCKLPFVTVYIDDNYYTASKEQHIQHLHHVFKVLSEANLTLSGSKCHLAMSKVSYLGMCFLPQVCHLIHRNERMAAPHQC